MTTDDSYDAVCFVSYQKRVREVILLCCGQLSTVHSKQRHQRHLISFLEGHGAGRHNEREGSSNAVF